VHELGDGARVAVRSDARAIPAASRAASVTVNLTQLRLTARTTSSRRRWW
jgi:hypothetical protein